MRRSVAHRRNARRFISGNAKVERFDADEESFRVTVDGARLEFQAGEHRRGEKGGEREATFGHIKFL